MRDATGRRPEAQLADRKLYCPRGKVVGGSGSINAMVYVRGQRGDYDDWANAGNPGWAYDDMLPSFRKLETHAAGATDPRHHGSTGPIHITSMKADVHPVVHEFLKGLRATEPAAHRRFQRRAVRRRGHLRPEHEER